MKSNKINAVSPHFFWDSRDVSDLSAEFGPHCGRYLLKYPEDWQTRFIEHAKELKPLDSRKAVEKLLKIIPSLVTKSKASKFDEEKTWQINVMELPITQSLGFKIGDALDPNPFNDWATSLDAIRETRANSDFIRPTISAHLSEIEPLIDQSPSFTIIDPYFNPVANPLQESFLASLLTLMSRGKCCEINIIVRRKEILSTKTPGPGMTMENLRHALQNSTSHRLRSGRNLRFYLVDDSKHPGAPFKLHARFYLSKFGGINIDQGVFLKESGYDTVKTLITYLDDKAHSNIMKNVCGPIFDFDTKAHTRLYDSYPKSVELLEFVPG
jgi:hypothetical protein